jgi:hypothetical protein
MHAVSEIVCDRENFAYDFLCLIQSFMIVCSMTDGYLYYVISLI